MPTDSLPFDDAAAPPAGPVEEAATAPSVLIVDDEEGIRNFLSRSLERRGWRVATAGSAEDGALHLERHCVDLIILDIALPGRSGLDWLRDLHAAGFGGDVILITAFADIDTAIEALRAGAADLILKPFRVEQIVNAIGRCMERTRLQRENFILRRQLAKPRGGTDEIIGRSAAIARLRALIERVAPSPSTVLIEGESGVGKELVARALHTRSHRADRPFVALNCAAVSADLVEAELFGHLRGAFTGAREARKGLFYYAHCGTLFLDEIGELPLALQSKLLRVLEERRIRPVGGEQELPVDVRVVAATNRDLKAEVAAGRFRSDLFYRLAVMTLRVPPLRERGDDVVELARRFMGVLSLRLGVPPLDITPPLEAALIAHPWPGNVRELRNLVERALLFGEFPQEDLGLPESGLLDAGLAMGHAPDGGDEGAGAASGQTLAEVEKRHILTVLADCGGNRARAAAVLGVSRKTLDRKWAEWGV